MMRIADRDAMRGGSGWICAARCAELILKPVLPNGQPSSEFGLYVGRSVVGSDETLTAKSDGSGLRIAHRGGSGWFRAARCAELTASQVLKLDFMLDGLSSVRMRR